jgi:hypothetical protein
MVMYSGKCSIKLTTKKDGVRSALTTSKLSP